MKNQFLRNTQSVAKAAALDVENITENSKQKRILFCATSNFDREIKTIFSRCGKVKNIMKRNGVRVKLFVPAFFDPV